MTSTPTFQPLSYPTNGESDSDTRLMATISVGYDPSEPSYLSYHVEPDPSEPSHPSVIRLTSDSSPSFATSRQVPPLVHGHERARGGGRGDDTPGGFGNDFLPTDE